MGEVKKADFCKMIDTVRRKICFLSVQLGNVSFYKRITFIS